MTTPSTEAESPPQLRDVNAQVVPPVEGPLSVALLQARRELWKAPPRWLPFVFGPLREFVLDPGLVIARLLLPLLTRRNLPRLNYWMAYYIQQVYQPTLQFFYHCPNTNTTSIATARDVGEEGPVSMRSQARMALLPNHHRVGVSPHSLIDKPSELESVILGVLGFLVSIIGDVLGALTNPKKYQRWMDACTQLESYLVSTGVSKELHKAIIHPLLRGRLLSNVKMLSDIQVSKLCVDRAQAAQFKEDDEGTITLTIRDEIKDGHKWMRFATAAYGTEMIRSALDRETDSDLILHQLEAAIAFHCQIAITDILLLYTNTDTDQHTLHHFLAVDHATKSIVLALRGTLSLSGAIVDVQGMAKDYCSGQAHQGMAEMADNIWKESGQAILKIINHDDNKYQGYTFVVTGHSLGAGTACLLNLKLHVEGLLGPNWPIRCYAFAPPPTFLANMNPDKDNDKCTPLIDQAIEHTIAYIHDNDVVPHISVSAVRRLAFLFEAVDHQSARLYFWQRWRIFYDYQKVPPPMMQAVVTTAAGGMSAPRAIQGACELIIPARVVVWCQHSALGKMEAFACDPRRVAQGHIYLSQDMLTDHLPEQYENALDALMAENK